MPETIAPETVEAAAEPLKPKVELFPFPMDQLAEAWRWLQEKPRYNFDDYGPRTLDAFREAMLERVKTQRVLGVSVDSRLVGTMGFCLVSSKAAMMCGICFSREVHGKGVALEAMKKLLRQLRGAGVEKLSAMYFEDNGRVRRFLQKLGAVDEGRLKNHTFRGGVPVNCRLVAIFLKEG